MLKHSLQGLARAALLASAVGPTHPQMWSANGTVDQQWVIQPSGSGYSITSVQSNLVVDGAANQVGVNPQMYNANGTVDQQWMFQ